MSIGATNCWIITGGPDPGDNDWDPCYPDAANANLYAAEHRREGHPGAAVLKRDADCLYADCDGCYLPLEGDDGIVHAPTREFLDQSIAALEWIVTDDGRVLCEECRDHPIRGGRPAEAPHLPIPGDVPMFDLEDSNV